MKDRWIAVRGRAFVLVSLLVAQGLLLPSRAEARPAAKRGSAQGQDQTEGSHARAAKGKGKRRGGAPRSLAPARGQAAKAACTAAFGKAKEAAQDSHLREANEWFAVCAQASCGRWMKQRCTTVHTKIAAMLPSVVPVVTDASGDVSQEIVVKMDGALLTSNLDGSAIVVDPGEHQFTFAKNGEIFATRRLALERGQQHQLLAASLEFRKRAGVAEPAAVPIAQEGAGAEPPAPALRKVQAVHALAESEAVDEEATPNVLRRQSSRRAVEAASPKTGAPWSAYALAGVGVLGVGGYFTFNLKGSADNDALQVLCKPDCGTTNVRHIRNIYLAADISLGIGLAALAGSTYLFLHAHDAEAESPRSRPRGITGLSLAPTASGGVATVGGTF